MNERKTHFMKLCIGNTFIKLENSVYKLNVLVFLYLARYREIDFRQYIDSYKEK